MTTTSTKSSSFVNLSILHKAMLAGQIIFAGVSIYLVFTSSFTENFQHLDQVLQAIAIAISAGGFYAGSFLFKKKLSETRDLQLDAKEKMALFKKACILQWSLMEGPCLFVIFCFLLTHNYAFLALAALLILIFTLMAPSKSKIVLQLQVSEKELNEL